MIRRFRLSIYVMYKLSFGLSGRGLLLLLLPDVSSTSVTDIFRGLQKNRTWSESSEDAWHSRRRKKEEEEADHGFTVRNVIYTSGMMLFEWRQRSTIPFISTISQVVQLSFHVHSYKSFPCRFKFPYLFW